MARSKPPHLTRHDGRVCVVASEAKGPPRMRPHRRRRRGDRLFWTICGEHETYHPNAKPRTDNTLTCLVCVATPHSALETIVLPGRNNIKDALEAIRKNGVYVDPEVAFVAGHRIVHT